MTDSVKSFPFILLCGQPKRGKTAAALAAVPRALCVGDAAAIGLTGRTVLGFQPDVYPVAPRNLEELLEILELLAEEWDGEQYDGLYVDDVTLVAENSMEEWRIERPTNPHYRWGRLQAVHNQISGVIRHFPATKILSYHETPPGDQGRGGPKLPSKNRTADAPPWADLVGRVTVDPDSINPFFPASLYVDPFGSWITGDRFDLCWKTTPLNLREIMRAADVGMALSRPEGLEWLDDLATATAEALHSAEPDDKKGVLRVCRTVSRPFTPFDTTRHDVQLRWGMSDGIARYVIERRLSAGLFGLADLGLDAPAAPTRAPGAPPPPPPPPPRSR